MRSVLIALVFLVTQSLVANDQIVLKTKPLNKDIKKQFGIIEYQMRQIDVDSSININGKFYTLGSFDSTIGYLYAGRVNSCRAGGCAISRSQIGDESFEYFDYFILFDNSKKIKNIRVFNYQATHGQEVSSQAWLKQFRGHKAEDNLQIGKDIDAISGATISVYAITADIEYISKVITRL